jgi:uncharacterized protein (DUF1697 family)
MAKYLAFLRSINVGGHNLIKMKDLMEMFISMGFSNVKTYIQSGNIRFETTTTDSIFLKQEIELQLEKVFGLKVCVVLRTLQEVENCLKHNIFNDYTQDTQVKFYICFLEKMPENTPLLPLINLKEGLEIIRIIDDNVFIVSRPLGNRFGFPNNFIEKEFGILSTARNLNTIVKVLNDK